MQQLLTNNNDESWQGTQFVLIRYKPNVSYMRKDQIIERVILKNELNSFIAALLATYPQVEIIEEKTGND